MRGRSRAEWTKPVADQVSMDVVLFLNSPFSAISTRMQSALEPCVMILLLGCDSSNA
jgi:hypothetical protein